MGAGGRGPDGPLRVLQVVHGFPPRENAGTERYAATLAAGLRARGHDVHTFAATVDPARRMYAVIHEDRLTRVVNNVPGREARSAGSDSEIDRIFDEVRRSFKPDLIHVQHLAGLSVTLPRADVPTVWTLHDAWGWCAAGGTLLKAGPPLVCCDGPGPDCARCASLWMRDTPRVDAALGLAARAGRWIRPDHLHRAWKILPGRVRASLSGGSPAPLTHAQVTARLEAFRQFAAGCDVVAPSRFLAELAESNGIPGVSVVRHGVAPGARREPPAEDAPFVFLGTLARHKGPDRVRAAWEIAGRPAPLRIHGPPGPDPTFRVPNDGPLDHAHALELLGRARALVVGSIWPENAPLVVLEARAAGCPVIAPLIGGIPEIVEDGVDGWLYPPGDVQALAERLSRPLPARVRPAPDFEGHLDAMIEIYGRALSRPVSGARSHNPSRSSTDAVD